MDAVLALAEMFEVCSECDGGKHWPCISAKQLQQSLTQHLSQFDVDLSYNISDTAPELLNFFQYWEQMDGLYGRLGLSEKLLETFASNNELSHLLSLRTLCLKHKRRKIGVFLLSPYLKEISANMRKSVNEHSKAGDISITVLAELVYIEICKILKREPKSFAAPSKSTTKLTRRKHTTSSTTSKSVSQHSKATNERKKEKPRRGLSNCGSDCSDSNVGDFSPLALSEFEACLTGNRQVVSVEEQLQKLRIWVSQYKNNVVGTLDSAKTTPLSRRHNGGANLANPGDKLSATFETFINNLIEGLCDCASLAEKQQEGNRNSTSEHQVEQLTRYINKLTKVGADAQTQKEDALKQRNQARLENQTLLENLESLEEKNAELEELREKLNSDLIEETEKVLKLQKIINQRSKRDSPPPTIRELEKQCKKAEERAQQAETEILHFREQLENLQEENESLVDKLQQRSASFSIYKDRDGDGNLSCGNCGQNFSKPHDIAFSKDLQDVETQTLPDKETEQAIQSLKDTIKLQIMEIKELKTRNFQLEELQASNNLSELVAQIKKLELSKATMEIDGHREKVHLQSRHDTEIMEFEQKLRVSGILLQKKDEEIEALTQELQSKKQQESLTRQNWNHVNFLSVGQRGSKQAFSVRDGKSIDGGDDTASCVSVRTLPNQLRADPKREGASLVNQSSTPKAPAKSLFTQTGTISSRRTTAKTSNKKKS